MGLLLKAQRPSRPPCPRNRLVSESFLVSAHLLVVPTSSSDSRPKVYLLDQSGCLKPFWSSRILLPTRPASTGELRLSKTPAALALPASASQVKGHQAPALRPPAVRSVLLPLPQHLWPKASQSTLPWWVSFQRRSLETTIGSVRKVRQGWPGWETKSALLRTPGETLVTVALARPRLGYKASVQTGRSWNQYRRDKAMTKYPASLGTLPFLGLLLFLLAQRGHRTPLRTQHVLHLPPLPTSFSCPEETSSLHPSPRGSPQNSTGCIQVRSRHFLPWLPTGIRKIPIPSMRSLQGLAHPLLPSLSLQ